MLENIRLLSVSEAESHDNASWLDKDVYELLLPMDFDDQQGLRIRAANGLTNGGIETVQALLEDTSWLDAARVKRFKNFGTESARTVTMALRSIGFCADKEPPPPWKCWNQDVLSQRCMAVLTDGSVQNLSPEEARDIQEGLMHLEVFLANPVNARALAYIMNLLPKGG